MCLSCFKNTGILLPAFLLFDIDCLTCPEKYDSLN